MSRPLSGLTVVALEQAVAAPLCTGRLAQAGARVIKVERPSGDFARDYDNAAKGNSAYFAWTNAGKESIVLDIKLEDDKALLHRIINTADVFVQNLAPGAAARAGFGSETLRGANPRLITVDISGYAETGPYRDMKAYDFLIQCESGLASISGGPEAPGRVGVSVADICCGMNAHGAILEALYMRERTGAGTGIAVSLFDGLAEWMTVPLLHFDYTGQAPKRMGLSHPSIAPYGEFKLPSGKSIVIAVQNNREWRNLCTLLKREDMVSDPRFADNISRCANRVDLDEHIRAALADLDSDTLSTSLKEAKIAFAYVRRVDDLSTHPQLRRIAVMTPTGAIEMPAPPVRWINRRNELLSVPRLNSHGEQIRAEFA